MRRFSREEEQRPPAYSVWDVFFCCAEGLLRKGQEPGRRLTERDAEAMLASDGALHARDSLQGAWDARVRAGTPSLCRSIASFGAWPFLVAAVLHLCEMLVQFVSPVMIKRIVDYVDSGESDIGLGVFLAMCFFLTPLCQSIMASNFICHCRRLGLRTLSATSCMVFEKVMRLSQPAASAYGPGALVNIMQVDTQRFDQSFFHLNFIWSMPLMLVVGVSLLYANLGVAAFTPLVIMGVMFPLNRVLVRSLMENSRARSRASDARIKVLTEVLHAVRLVKMLAWEDRIADIVREKRNAELSTIATQKKFEIMNGLVWQGVPVLLPLATFGVFTLLGGTLDPGLVFSSLSLLDMIRVPMNLFPQALQVMVQVSVGVDRIEKLLLAEEIQTRVEGLALEDGGAPGQSLPPVHTRSRTAAQGVHLKGGSYRWADTAGAGQATADSQAAAPPRRRCFGRRTGGSAADGARPLLGGGAAAAALGASPVEAELARPLTLRVDELVIPDGSFVLVSGPVGGGKSTLLAGLLNEVPLVSGRVEVRGPIAFCAQLPWILQGTVRDNIILEEAFDASRFDKVVKACAIEPDLKELCDGDLTVIGERGINLSGGQKARIALARAAYKFPTASTYILDDPLAAVDVHVAAHLMDECLDSHKGLLRGKTRVLVTHQLQYLERADFLVVVKGGEVLACRPPSEFSPADLEAFGLQVPSAKAEPPAEEPLAGLPTGELATPPPALTLLRSYSNPSETSALSPKPGPDGMKLWPEAWEHSDCCLSTLARARPRLPRKSTVLLGSGFARAISEDDGAALASCPPALTLRRFTSAPVTDAESEWASQRDPLELRQRQQGPQGTGPGASEDGAAPVAEPRPEAGAPAPGVDAQEEERQVGALSLSVWLTYARAMGPCVAGCLACAYVATNATMLAQTFWLAAWSNSMVADAPEASAPLPPPTLLLLPLGGDGALAPHISLGALTVAPQWSVMLAQDEKSSFYYLIIYALLSSTTFMVLFCRMLIFRATSLKVSRSLHEDALWAVIRSPMSWLDTTPTGRTVNRFSQDQQKLDLEMQGTISAFADNIVTLSISLIVISIYVPVLLLLALPLLYYYNAIQKKFRLTARELQRLASVNKSPIFQGLDQAIAGISSLRAYEIQEPLAQENAHKVETAVRMIFNIMCCNRWLSIRLRTLGTAPVALVTLLLLLHNNVPLLARLSLGMAVQGGAVGLVLRYSLQLTTNMEGLLQSLTNTELCLVALERLSTLSEVSPEPVLLQDGDEARHESWPGSGQVRFESVTMRYREDLPTVLNSISFTVPGGTSVGVVGRTGAGKSSLLQALFRMCPLDAGRITIDGADISDMGLHTLRRRLAIIPQDPVGFTGTLRFNMDPFGERSDDEIMEQLRNVQLTDFASEEGLRHHLTSGGDNLSVGQRQLVCAARAFLRGCRILVLDEATASVDFRTDALIQDVLRNEVTTNQLTTITIAHRIKTIMGSDNVLVMDRGAAAEFGPPAALAADPSTRFHDLACGH